MKSGIFLNLQHIQPDELTVTTILAQVTDDTLFDHISVLLGRIEQYDERIMQAFLLAIEARGLLASPTLGPYLSATSIWHQTRAGSWLIASLLALRGEREQAVALWQRILDQHATGLPLHVAALTQARLLLSIDRPQEAFASLRRAISNQHEYRFLSKAASLLERLRRQAKPLATRHVRIAVLSSTTTDLSVPLLRLACFREEIDAEIYVAPYNTIRQEIMNLDSDLYAFQPDITIIATNWRDAHFPAFSETPDEQIQSTLTELQQMWTHLLDHHPCRIIQHNFDLPGIESFGHLSLTLKGGRAHMLRTLNQQLIATCPSSVTILDLDQVSARYGKRSWYDAAYWHLAKQYPATGALPLLVDHQVALIRGSLGLTKKVLVFDLDNTLWGGVISEDGLGSIRLGSPSATGEAYQALQHYARELKERGVLLAVCSKNNEQDARLPFLKHDAMILRLDDIAVFRANWQDKPANLRDIAQTLNLGIDSLVFLDDNPVERELVRREVPQVAVPEPGNDPATYIETLDRGMYFEALTLSDEDRQRHQSYRANALRTELRTRTASLDDFLRDLDMEAEIGAFNPTVLARVVQLIGKTNQFNLTTRRHSEQQIRRMLASKAYWTCYFKLRDKFDDNGLVGLLIARQLPDTPRTWEIDTWLMSCRVIGRQLELFMWQCLVEAARAQNVCFIRGVYIPTAKNAMVADLYDRLGFVPLDETRDGQHVYICDLRKVDVPACAFIRNQQLLSKEIGTPFSGNITTLSEL